MALALDADLIERGPLIAELDAPLIERLRRVGAVVERIGASAADRPLYGLRVGAADLPVISVVAGAHPDEPAGPVAALLLALAWNTDPLSQRFRLAVVPQLDVDGAVAQRAWLQPWSGATDLKRYLTHLLRREPGEDREFAWPRAPWGGTVLPECAAAAAFLRAQGPPVLHCSLHGLFQGSGVWYLLDPASLVDAALHRRLVALAGDLGLHDLRRHGDKGFRSAARGFCTTPSGPAMRRWALRHDRPVWARAFAYGSMDHARYLAREAGRPAPRCLVTEVPHMLVPVEQRGPWQEQLAAAATGDATAAERLLGLPGVTAVPWHRQLAIITGAVEALAASVPSWK